MVFRARRDGETTQFFQRRSGLGCVLWLWCVALEAVRGHLTHGVLMGYGTGNMEVFSEIGLQRADVAFTDLEEVCCWDGLVGRKCKTLGIFSQGSNSWIHGNQHWLGGFSFLPISAWPLMGFLLWNRPTHGMVPFQVLLGQDVAVVALVPEGPKAIVRSCAVSAAIKTRARRHTRVWHLVKRKAKTYGF